MSELKYIYIIYRTTNLVNHKIYIGVHHQEFHFPVLFDGYLGSGKHFQRAMKKYGEENFIREILFVFYTKDEAYAKEKEIVNEEFVLRKDTYNIRTGGAGSIKMTEESKEKMKMTILNWSEEQKEYNRTVRKSKEKTVCSEEKKQRNSLAMKKCWENRTPEERKIIIEKSVRNRSKCPKIVPEKARNPVFETLKKYWESLNPEDRNSNGKFPIGGWNKGIPSALETRKKISESNKGKRLNEEQREQRRKNTQTVWDSYTTEEREERIKKSTDKTKGKKQKLRTCPHCGKTGGGTMIRWHFDNCKSKTKSEFDIIIE